MEHQIKKMWNEIKPNVLSEWIAFVALSLYFLFYFIDTGALINGVWLGLIALGVKKFKEKKLIFSILSLFLVLLVTQPSFLEVD